MRKILESCPTCEHELVVTELTCPQCTTVIHGQYAICPFCRLSAENLAFLELFVRNKGNVKEMERELGVSYWAIRNRLNEVIDAMGFQGEPLEAEAVKAARREVLEQLERKEISVAEATERLVQLDASFE